MKAETDSNPGRVVFEPTRWSVVLQARDAVSEGARLRALGDLCSVYWYPLYAFLRSSGNALHDAQDLTQGFFASLADGRLLSVAAQEKGRFRTLLLLGLKRHAANAAQAQQAWKRGGRVQFVPLDEVMAEQRWSAESGMAQEPESAYDRAWAVAAMDAAVQRLREEYEAEGKGALFAALYPRLTGSGDGSTLAQTALALGTTEAALKMALVRMRRLFGHALRAAVADTVLDEADIQDEVRYLLSCFQ